VHARRVRPDTGPIDRRRLAAAGLSAVLPGLGQAFNRRSRVALLFLVPSLVVIGAGIVLISTQSLTRLAAFVVAPPVLGTLLTINVLLLVWRLLAVGQAFLDTRRPGPTGRLGIAGIAVILLLVAVPHVMAYRYGTAFGTAFAKMFDDERGAAEPTPALTDRINVLLVGVDATRFRTTVLTDTMMVVSLDPVGHTVTMLSLPRDLIDVPMSDGDVFGPKLNSLMSYADSNPDEFPDGGMAALEDAVGTLLGIDIQYHAELQFGSFIRMVDAVGGVDVEVVQGFTDPTYDGYGLEGRGWSITAGPHHLDGRNALAFSRSRKAPGESDFTRALRQQQVIVALRDAVTKDGSLLWELPGLLDAVGDAVRTDLPPSRLPQLAAILDEIDDDSITRSIIRHPLVRSVDTRYGSSLEPDLVAIRKVAAGLFPKPGLTPKPWPTPKPSAQP
jgi:polyisoprenyl-teichoic acid--peptidoglycan teichoic acid transferase